MADGIASGAAPLASNTSEADSTTSMSKLGEFLILLAGTGVAIAEPILSAFRDGADVFVLRRADAVDVVLFTLVVVLAPATVLWSVLQIVAKLSPGRRPLVRGSFVGLLGALVVIRVSYQVADPPRAVVVVLALAGGLAIAVALQRLAVIGAWLRLLAVFPLVLGLGFITTDPVANLVFHAGSGGVGATTVGSPDPVVVLVLDELPTASLLDDEDRISAEQFPNLSAFAEDATWYRNHTSVAPSTPQAVPAILTGSLPTSLDTLPSSDAYPDNLFTALRGAYRMHVQEGATRLCPADLCTEKGGGANPVGALLDDAVALWSDQLAADEEERQGDFTVRQSDPSAPETFNRFLSGVAGTDGPVLDFHHALYPHQPWFHLPSGLTYEAPFVAEGLDGGANYAWTGAPAAAAGQQRHLLQAQHADALVGLLMDRLRSTERYDQSLVVITADHGAAFDDGEPVRGLAAGNAEQVMWTPLLVKAPGQTDAVLDERPAQAIDVLPTIADHLDLELPFDTDGSSLLAEADTSGGASSGDERVFFEWGLNRLEAGPDGLIAVDGIAGYEQMLALPAPGAGEDAALRFFRFGRNAELVGQQIDDVATGAPIDGEARLDQRGALSNVIVDTSPVPAYLSGDVPGDEPMDIAVAVNGTIGGWGRTETAESADRQHYWTMVPPALLKDGANTITVALIEQRNGQPFLRPIPLAGS